MCGWGGMQVTNVREVYADKYKGIWICMMILARALNGSYVNFGVFELYGDPALNSALDATLRMALAIPLQVTHHRSDMSVGGFFVFFWHILPGPVCFGFSAR